MFRNSVGKQKNKEEAVTLLSSIKNVKLTALIPTYSPDKTTYNLVVNLLLQSSSVSVIVIDDSTPLNAKRSIEILTDLKTLAKTNKQLTVLRTPTNYLKAGALNFGIAYIASQKTTPDVVLTLDDDVSIIDTTIPYLLAKLSSNKKIGVVCTTAWVKNKNANMLTRLQSLEYHNFTVTKIGDNGFLKGPLVMQGMLAAFRYNVLIKINGFLPEMILEDYDITVRVKNAGYISAIEPKAIAYTIVPETMSTLLKQRIRWSYGGLVVLQKYITNVSSVFQDIIGHAIFICLFSLIALSFVIRKTADTPLMLILLVIIAALVNFITAFTFNAITLLKYPHRDKKDWFIKLSLLPEFMYNNLLSGILIGSYIFFAYTVITNLFVKHLPRLHPIQKGGYKVFQRIGYTTSWGTRI